MKKNFLKAVFALLGIAAAYLLFASEAKAQVKAFPIEACYIIDTDDNDTLDTVTKDAKMRENAILHNLKSVSAEELKEAWYKPDEKQHVYRVSNFKYEGIEYTVTGDKVSVADNILITKEKKAYGDELVVPARTLRNN